MGCGSTKPTTTSVQPEEQKSPNELVTEQNQQGLASTSQRSATHSVESSVHSRRSWKNSKEPSIRSGTPVEVTENPLPEQNNISPAKDDAEPTPSRPPSQQSIKSDSSSKSGESSHSKSKTSKSIGRKPSAPAVELDGNAARKNAESPLSFLDATYEKSKIRSSTRNSFVTPLPHIDRDQTGSMSKSGAPEDGKPSLESHGHAFRCRYCRHCRQLNSGRIRSKLKWIIENPTVDKFVIEMDNYDIDAVTTNVITENGHFPGCYDYRPYLTIDELNHTNNFQNDGDYDKLPFIIRKTSHITPAHTPFPEYDYLQRHDQRPNKPYDLSLFAD
ncbi:unnamed protein product [Rotaria magnacalcarata]|uniref:Uncharacterized protein n=3 Tax=Rotaria magnacalcarata TaxID=392030 RepID=A0A814U3U2_9BILA|nr:unnamed protein product [Rotaria magnacalcarata]CAF1636768.1 unnamed protein product [Rotaria magnacalcarata]CAF2106138.1 unnamed protein product [Rotaria magnacalcarata]CAF3859267.1 unnamed protein product [Rotaria magnacalcarata]CAF4098944.1 unnamed protein product [Rotaria magnacalcarata]